MVHSTETSRAGNCEYTKGKKQDINASELINIDEVIIDKDFRSSGSRHA